MSTIEMSLIDQLIDAGAMYQDGKVHSRAKDMLAKTRPALLQALMHATHFLPESAGMSCRMFCVRTGITCLPVCASCAAPVSFNNKGAKSYFSRFCSNKCSSSHPDTKARAAATNLTKYGTDHYLKTSKGKEQVKATNLLRYGNEYATQSQSVKDKTKQTCQLKYGVEYVTQADAKKQKTVSTWIEKYGVDHPSKSQQVRDKTRNTNVLLYGTEAPAQNADVKRKIQNTNLERYGTTCSISSRQADLAKVRARTNTNKYGTPHTSQRHISPDTLALLDDRDWLISEHHIQQKSLTEIANHLGVNPETVRHRFVDFDISIHRYATSYGHRQVVALIDSLGVDRYLNSRYVIPPKELDIYIPSHSLAIEYCGLYWHNDSHQRITTSYHADKTDQCRAHGIQLLTIFEDEWTQKQEIVTSKIAHALGHTSRAVHARKCNIVQVAAHDKRVFFDATHIQGDGPGSICYGLVNDNELVAAMAFIAQKNKTYVLNRYASSLDSRVVGGFTKLLTHFTRSHEWSQIVTFADLRWSYGKLYTAHGFTHDKTLPPDYAYVVGNQRRHKFNFRRAALQKMLPDFDPQLSERQNCDNAGIGRVWDCGKMRFVLNNE